MQTTLFNHPRISLSLKTGSEGPRHDPYGFEEYEIDTPSGETTLHLGLGFWLKHNGRRIEAAGRAEESELCGPILKKLTGFSLDEILALKERVEKHRSRRCAKCGASSRHFRSESGFPGEHFTVCGKCGHVADSYFCESEII